VRCLAEVAEGLRGQESPRCTAPHCALAALVQQQPDSQA
jgi:hypothetical protein